MRMLPVVDQLTAGQSYPKSAAPRGAPLRWASSARIHAPDGDALSSREASREASPERRRRRPAGSSRGQLHDEIRDLVAFDLERIGDLEQQLALARPDDAVGDHDLDGHR